MRGGSSSFRPFCCRELAPESRVVGGVRIVIVLILLAVVLRGWEELRRAAPWRPLSLDEDVRPLAARKIDALHGDIAACRALLPDGRVGFSALDPVRSSDPNCGFDDGVALAGDDFAATPSVRASCPTAAALILWRRQVADPAAARLFGARVERIETFGTYSCRRIANSRTGSYSEHATGDAVDIAAFELADGTRISVRRDWTDDGPKGAFLRELRDGGCDIFATTLSPDYNAAHADHLHLDTARRGGMTFCR